MSYVLAIEPHQGQAEILLQNVGARAGARLTVVDSMHAAMTAIDDEVPNLVLVSALMPPQEEGTLLARLRGLPEERVPQILIIPSLAPPEIKQRRKLFSRFRSQGPRPDGCDPFAFADQVSTYLDHGDRRSKDLSARHAARLITMPAPSGANRRAAVRSEQIDWAKAIIDGAGVDLVDLSATGAQVLAPIVLPPGRSVQVRLSREAQAIQCEAGIVWGSFEILGPTQAPGFRAGLNFRDTDRAAVEQFYSQRG